MMKFKSKIVIGLEVHISLKTNSKLFCACKNPSFHGKHIEPNTNVCPICLGHPGSKPTVNKSVIVSAIKLANALNCKIPSVIQFDRKNYFYPDLVKNFQITQDQIPIGDGGKVQIGINDFIELDHIHIEEDPGSMIIENGGTLIDYNRSGTPLIELVTKPIMTEPAQAREFLKKLIIILEYLDIFDRYNCTVKADANVSIKESGYTRVEIKNINGFKDIEEALNFEIERQKGVLSEGGSIKLETRGWDGKKTIFQRSKEEAMDYAYYPENDLPAGKITPALLKEGKVNLTDLYYNRIQKLLSSHDINLTDLEIIYEDKNLANLFESSILKLKLDPQNISNYFRNKLISVLNKLELNITELHIKESNLLHLIKLYFDKKIDNKTNSKLLLKIIEDNQVDIKTYIEDNNLEQSDDDEFLTDLAKKVISENTEAVDAYKNGDSKSINFLVGMVMKLSSGKANPGSAKSVLEKLLK